MALLKIGENTVSPIAKEASVSLSKIYEILENLIKKGLVSSIIKNNIRYFLATPPERILDYLELRKREIVSHEEKIKEIMPGLISQKNQPEKGSTGTLYEGIKGIKTFYELVLKEIKKDEEILVMGIPRHSAEQYEGYFLNWNKKRAEKRAKIKIIFDSNARDLGKKREAISFTKIKYLPNNLSTPAWILIYKNGVATIHLAEKPICFLIKDKKVVESYKKFFDLLWNLSTN